MILVQLWKFFSHTQNTVGTVIILLCLKFLAILSEFFASCIKSVDKKIKTEMNHQIYYRKYQIDRNFPRKNVMNGLYTRLHNVYI